MNLLDELESRVVCGDGAIGTLLLNAGVPIEWCFEQLCISDPDRIQKIHGDYIGAGARVIETNTFGANAVRLARFGFENRVSEINRAAVMVARKAAGNRGVYLAGSVGPSGMTADDAVARGIDLGDCFREQITALVDAGVNAIFLETFTDYGEMEIALQAKNNVSNTPAICSFACATEGKLRCGMSLSEAFGRLRRQGGRVMGVNCLNDPSAMVKLLGTIADEKCLAAYPTAGRPKKRNGQLHFEVTAESFANCARKIIALGARLVGGCCGTTPAHIAALAKVISDLPSR